MGAWIEISGRNVYVTALIRSHPTMGAWIEILNTAYCTSVLTASHPTMGAWIEILKNGVNYHEEVGRTPRWVRGLKFILFVKTLKCAVSRTPRWVRGLKLHKNLTSCLFNPVAPHDGCVD